MDLANGIPSEATMRRVFSLLKPESIEKVCCEWITPYIGNCMNKQISIDGKTVCGVARGSGEMNKLHVVSAWVREDGVCFGQVRTADGKTFAELMRNHWDIENGLYWILDTAFHEDDSLIHTGHAPENFSILRKLAMALL